MLRTPKPEYVCPHCGHVLAQLEAVEGGKPVKPSRGDVVVCKSCARPSVFAGKFRPEVRAELVKHLRHRGYVKDRAEMMFAGDAEFRARWAAIESLMVSS